MVGVFVPLGSVGVVDRDVVGVEDVVDGDVVVGVVVVGACVLVVVVGGGSTVERVGVGDGGEVRPFVVVGSSYVVVRLDEVGGGSRGGSAGELVAV